MVNAYCDDKEWTRRRQMRIMQVREQSNDIARRLRERVKNEEHQRRLEEKNELETKLKIWKVKRLTSLEEMFRKAISEFGSGHKMATEEPNPAEEMKEKQKQYLCKAKERGETAMELELKEKREAAEKKQIPIQRKIITRKIEDLRSSLVCSIPVKKPSVILRDIYAGKPFNPNKFQSYHEFKKFVQKYSNQEENMGIEKQDPKSLKSSFGDCAVTGKMSPRKQKSGRKNVIKSKDKSGITSVTDKDKTAMLDIQACGNTWVNLGAVEVLTEEEQIQKGERSKEEMKKSKSEKEWIGENNSKGKEKIYKSNLEKKAVTSKKEEPVVECYGYSLSHNCKLKDTAYTVERMNNLSEPNAIELALKEEEKLLLKENEKEIRKMAAEERGNKAMEKERIIKSYNELLVKLEKLSTKEKLIKSYCHIPPLHHFLSDERRKEKCARKQRIMESEFERIYYDVVGAKPDKNLNARLNLQTPVQEIDAENDSECLITKLDFNKLDSNLKTNSPVMSDQCGSREKAKSDTIRSPVEKVSIKKTPSSLHFKRTKIIKGDKNALHEIDEILRKSRELRQDSHRNANISPGDCKSDPECYEKVFEANHETENISCASTDNASIELELCKSDSSSPYEGNRVSDITELKKSPEKNLSGSDKAILEDLAMGDLPRNAVGMRTNIAAWPVHEIKRTQPQKQSSGRSSSTSYRSLPPEIHPRRIASLMRILGQLKEREGMCTVADELIVELEGILVSLIDEFGREDFKLNEEDCREFLANPKLNNYITKLLHMSREKVASLDVSSDSDTSLPKTPTSCKNGKDRSTLPADNKYLQQTSQNSKTARINRAKELEDIIKKWKNILEQKLKDCPPLDDLNPFEVDENELKRTKWVEASKKREQIQEISKKCADRMAVLSELLKNYGNKRNRECVNVPKRPTLTQNDVNIIKNNNLEAFLNLMKENQACAKSVPSRKTLICDDDTCPFLKHLPRDKNANCEQQANAGQPNKDDSLESYPDVMAELLKKNIISSPFRWTQGKPSGNCGASGSRQPGRGKAGPVHEQANPINPIIQPSERYEQGCPKPVVTKCLYEPYKCKDLCKGACASRVLIPEAAVPQQPENLQQPEKPPVCEEQIIQVLPQNIILQPQKSQVPANYRDPACGLYSPVATNGTQGKKNRLNQLNDNIDNPCGVAPTASGPFYEPQEERPQPSSSKITQAKRPEAAQKRPQSSPASGSGRGPRLPDCGYQTNARDRNDNYQPYFHVSNLDGNQGSACGSRTNMQENMQAMMSEWTRRNAAIKKHQERLAVHDSCIGSCVVNRKNDEDRYKLRAWNSCLEQEGHDRIENYGMGAHSFPDIRLLHEPYDKEMPEEKRLFVETWLEHIDLLKKAAEEHEEGIQEFDVNWAKALVRDLTEGKRC